MEVRSVSPSLGLLGLARRAKDLVLGGASLPRDDQVGPVASPAHRCCRLSLLHVVDAAFGDATLVELGLAAVAAVIVEATQAVFGQSHTRHATHSLVVCERVGDS